MTDLDTRIERALRALARRTSRRTFLARFGTLLVGGAALPLLPVARGAAENARAPAPDENIEGIEGDPTRCEYWRHCAIDGFACACCTDAPTERGLSARPTDAWLRVVRRSRIAASRTAKGAASRSRSRSATTQRHPSRT